jgi:hypothetical protein
MNKSAIHIINLGFLFGHLEEVLTLALSHLSFALKKIRDNRLNPWLKNGANEPNLKNQPRRTKSFFAKQTQFPILQNRPNLFIHKLITVNC